MLFCSQCGTQLEESAKFCSKCGTPVAAPVEAPVETPVETPVAAPAATTPVYTPVYSAPVYSAPATVEVSGSTKAQGFIGMGLAIGGLFFAVLGLIYTLVGLDYDALGFGMSIGFGIFSMPLSIVGRILSRKSMDCGNTSGVCRAGSGLGLAGFIVSCVMFAFGFISLLAS